MFALQEAGTFSIVHVFMANAGPELKNIVVAVKIFFIVLFLLMFYEKTTKHWWFRRFRTILRIASRIGYSANPPEPFVQEYICRRDNKIGAEMRAC